MPIIIGLNNKNPYENLPPVGAAQEGQSNGKVYKILTYDKTYSGAARLGQFLKAFFATFFSLGLALISPKIRNSFKKAVEGHALKTIWMEKGPQAQAPVQEAPPQAAQPVTNPLDLPPEHPLSKPQMLFLVETRQAQAGGKPPAEWLTAGYDEDEFNQLVQKTEKLELHQNGVHFSPPMGFTFDEELLRARIALLEKSLNKAQLELLAGGDGILVRDLEAPWNLSRLPLLVMTPQEMGNLTLDQYMKMSPTQQKEVIQRKTSLPFEKARFEIFPENFQQLTLSNWRCLDARILTMLLPIIPVSILSLLSQFQHSEVDLSLLTDQQIIASKQPEGGSTLPDWVIALLNEHQKALLA